MNTTYDRHQNKKKPPQTRSRRPHPKKKPTKERRRASAPRRSMDAQLMGSIHDLLVKIRDSQKYLTYLAKRRIGAEERQADALVIMIDTIKSLDHDEAPAHAKPAALAHGAFPARVTGEDRADVARLILALREQSGYSYENIARHFEAAGLPTISGRGKWSGQTVLRLYKNALKGIF